MTTDAASIPQLVVIVPALRETMTIVGCIEHFSKLCAVGRHVRLLVVCSLAERQQSAVQPSQNPTLDLALAAAAEVNRRLGFRFITVIEYPYANGQMAHQINWGLRYLYKAIDAGIDPHRTVIGVFNADSRPSSDSISQVQSAFTDENVLVGQQSSIYRVPEGTPRSAMVPYAAAIWQTRWSVAIELPRYWAANCLANFLKGRINGDRSKQLFRALTPNAYVVGHGVWLRLDYLTELNYFPSDIPNEDAALGFTILADGRSPTVLGGFDVAEVPLELKTLVLQQAVWFGGPALSHAYPSFARNVGALNFNSKWDTATAGLLATRTFLDALYWLLGPALFVVLCSIALITGHILTGFAVLAFLAYLVVPSAFAGLLFLPYQNRMRSILLGSLGMPLFYLVHGVGAVLWISWRMRAIITGNQLPKPKTER